MRSKLALICAILICLSVPFLFIWDVLVLQITLPGQDTIIYQETPAPGTLLCMRYIHSVEKTPVQGWFALDPQGGFRAVRTRTTGTGTGLPNVVDADNVRMQGKWMVVDEGNTYVPQIPFYYLPLNQLRISVDGQEVDLSTVPPGSRLLITCKQTSLAKALFPGKHGSTPHGR
jgi:hypothetical protein